MVLDPKDPGQNPPDPNTPPQDPPPADPPPDPKPRLAGSDFYRQKLADADAKIAEMAAKIDEKETETLKQKENYKGLYELEKKKREEAEAKNTKISKNYFEDKKVEAVEREAIKLGILDVALEDVKGLDVDVLQVETTNLGRSEVIGAKDFVEQLKIDRPHWFNKTGAPIVNNGPPGDPPKPKELTADELVQLQKKDPEKYKIEMNKRLNKR
jgi:hypothetical protein